ncbi:hypothetical protein V6N12_021068 [Hibiscus sabdariffa]|uniref:Uncharacterized protein n=1 Tax=Hibiscus sabdariffa TaxID=183260 RepID=A0ABR2B5B4_9ROSI
MVNMVTASPGSWFVDSGASHHVSSNQANMVHGMEYEGPGAEWFWKEGQKTGSKAAIADNVQESAEMEPIHGQQNEGAAVGDECQSYNETRAEGSINDQGSRESDRLGESSSTNEVLGTVDIDNTVHDSVHSSQSTHGICVEDTPAVLKSMLPR